MNNKNWSIKKAEETYNINNWGKNFFRINKEGNVEVVPGKNSHTIDLKNLLDDIKSKNLSLPILIRFSDIFQKCIENIYNCFQVSSAKYGYKGNYFGVYPIKVNQQRQVLEEVVTFGYPYNFGMEVGSKPELLAALALMDNPKGLIICNGYKDNTYVKMALMGRKLNRKIIIVVEKPEELSRIISISKNLNIHPTIGLRIKLSTSGSGLWKSSGGENSKFGLTAADIMDAIESLKAKNMLSCLKLLHFHIGSQITDIRYVKQGLIEIRRYYAELFKLGCNIEYIDVGGGLGVDYDGSMSTSHCSTNYSTQEYANDIIYHFLEICEEENLPHPHIISESGRALTAYHSIIIFDVIESGNQALWKEGIKISENDDNTIIDLHEILKEWDSHKIPEHWHDAQELKEQAISKFNIGLISISERSKVERLFWTIANKVFNELQKKGFISDEFKNLKDKVAYKYFCNFSLFQSVPDSWAINQIFPIMPIHRHNEYPECQATLQDITCDSDGKIDQFIHNRQISSVLPVHKIKKGEDYFLGIFLVGAYQEILGDLHNLFGDTNTVHVSLNDDGTFNYEQIIHGENIAEVLNYVQFNSDHLMEKISHHIGISLGSGIIKIDEGKDFINFYRKELLGYTYFSKEG